MSTKIINILKDDKFEEVLDLFTETSADEVVLVLPKKSQAFNSESSFAALAIEASKQNKEVLVLTSNSEINELALQYNFTVLTANKSFNGGRTRQEVETRLVADVDDDIDNEDDSFEIDDDREGKESTEGEGDDVVASDSSESNPDSISHDNSGEQPMVELVKATTKKNRAMADIIRPQIDDEAVTVKISKKTEQAARVGIRKTKDQKAVDKSIIDDIQDVWGSRSKVDDIFPSFSKKSINFNLSKNFKSGWPKLDLLSKKGTTVFGILSIVILAIVVYITVGSADIFIKPKAHTLDFSLKIFTSDKFSTVDSVSKKIPGQLFSIDKKIDQAFQATGERDVAQKSRGKITVYNNYGTTPQTLIATTRFESNSGFIFRTLKTIIVPGTKVQNGEIIPGSIEVEVIADKAGNAYNIEPGKFFILAFKEKGDLDRYGKFYGLSKEPMKGGIVGKAKIVTEKDYMDAKKVVEERILDEAASELENQSAGLKILNVPSPVIKEVTSTAQIDEAVDSFTVSGMAHVEIVGFKEADLYELIGKFLNSAGSFKIFPDKLQIDFKDIVFDKDQKVLEFTIFVKGSAYSVIDEQKMVTDLIGKDEKQIRDYLKDIEDISSARVLLSPFWVYKVPTNKDKIKFEFEY